MDSSEAAEILRDMRWGEDIFCIHCGSGKVVKNGIREDYIQQYRCNSCEKSFNDRSKTVFSETKMSVLECLRSISMMEKGFSTSKISEKLERNWKTIDKFLKLVKQSPETFSLASRFEEERSADIDYSKMGCGSNPQFR